MIHQHQQIAEQRPIHRPMEHGRGNVQLCPFLQSLDVQGQNGHAPEACPAKGFADHMQVIGAPAGISCLGNHQHRIGKVVLPAAESMEHLTDDEHRRIAQIIVGILQTQGSSLRASLQDHRGIPGRTEGIPQQRKMEIQHSWNQYGGFRHGIPSCTIIASASYYNTFSTTGQERAGRMQSCRLSVQTIVCLDGSNQFYRKCKTYGHVRYIRRTAFGSTHFPPWLQSA